MQLMEAVADLKARLRGIGMWEMGGITKTCFMCLSILHNLLCLNAGVRFEHYEGMLFTHSSSLPALCFSILSFMCEGWYVDGDYEDSASAIYLSPPWCHHVQPLALTSSGLCLSADLPM